MECFTLCTNTTLFISFNLIYFFKGYRVIISPWRWRFWSPEWTRDGPRWYSWQKAAWTCAHTSWLPILCLHWDPNYNHLIFFQFINVSLWTCLKVLSKVVYYEHIERHYIIFVLCTEMFPTSTFYDWLCTN